MRREEGTYHYPVTEPKEYSTILQLGRANPMTLLYNQNRAHLPR
jgi:hypothetical protein